MGSGRAMVGGIVGGTVGAALMLPVFEGAKRVGLLREAPPVRVIDRAAAEATDTGQPLAAGDRQAAAVVSHVVYGAVAGALYGLAQEKLEMPAAAAGPVYGLLLWAVGYLGWMPAAGVLPEPWRQRRGDALVPVAAHLVFGLALGLVARVGRRER